MLHDGDEHGNGDEHHDEAAHGQHLLFLIHVLDDIVLEKVERQRRAGSHDQTGERGHGGRKHEDDDDADQKRREVFQHRGDDGVVAVGGDVYAIPVEPAKAAEEVAAARHDHGKQRGDDRALVDGLFRADGVELLHHLRKAPGAQRSENDHAEKFQRLGAEEGGERAGRGGHGGVLHAGERVHGRHEAAVFIEHCQHHHDDAAQHDQALNKIVDGRGHVAARHHVDAGQRRHEDDTERVVDVEGHAEQPGKAVVERGRVGDEEDKDDDGRADLQPPGAEALAEELRHGGAVQVLAHQPRAAAEHHPGQQRAQKGVA